MFGSTISEYAVYAAHRIAAVTIGSQDLQIIESADAQVIAMALEDGTITVWDRATQERHVFGTSTGGNALVLPRLDTRRQRMAFRVQGWLEAANIRFCHPT